MFIDEAQDKMGNIIENFTIEERLNILTKMNPIFNKNSEIRNNGIYWDFIKAGLCDQDP